MSANKWTSGPWHVDPERPIVTGIADGMFIADCCGMNGDDTTDFANASLIAAAPDLAEALRRIEEGCSFPKDDVQRACRDVARAALAKARGEE